MSINNKNKDSLLAGVESGDNSVDKSEKIVYIASDHAGFDMKEDLKGFLAKAGWSVEDFGPKTFDKDDDYPDFVVPMARKVATEGKLGIALCANGQGACIAANKVKGIRAATAMTPEMANTTRTDDDANILCIPADYLDSDNSKKIALEWLRSPFSGAERHKRRIKKVMDLEE